MPKLNGKAPLPSALRARLAAVVKECGGERGASERLRIHADTITRALAGLDIRQGTAALIEVRLQEQGA